MPQKGTPKMSETTKKSAPAAATAADEPVMDNVAMVSLHADGTSAQANPHRVITTEADPRPSGLTTAAATATAVATIEDGGGAVAAVVPQ